MKREAGDWIERVWNIRDSLSSALKYDRLPQLGRKRLPAGVAGRLRGIEHMDPLIGVGSVLVAASVLMLAWNLLVATCGAGAATAAIRETGS